jgi:hypothetical protein
VGASRACRQRLGLGQAVHPAGDLEPRPGQALHVVGGLLHAAADVAHRPAFARKRGGDPRGGLSRASQIRGRSRIGQQSGGQSLAPDGVGAGRTHGGGELGLLQGGDGGESYRAARELAGLIGGARAQRAGHRLAVGEVGRQLGGAVHVQAVGARGL